MKKQSIVLTTKHIDMVIKNLKRKIKKINNHKKVPYILIIDKKLYKKVKGFFKLNSLLLNS